MASEDRAFRGGAGNGPPIPCYHSVVTVRFPGSDRGQRKANELSPEGKTAFRSQKHLAITVDFFLGLPSEEPTWSLGVDGSSKVMDCIYVVLSFRTILVSQGKHCYGVGIGQQMPGDLFSIYSQCRETSFSFFLFIILATGARHSSLLLRLVQLVNWIPSFGLASFRYFRSSGSLHEEDIFYGRFALDEDYREGSLVSPGTFIVV
jgi:hypothetical protein